MSEDLIRRSDAIKAIASLHILADEEKIFKVYADNPHSMTTDFEGTLIDAINAIKGIPTIEPKQGEWIFKTVFPNDKSEFPMGYLVCSVCGSHHHNSTPCNYCDNCGARMKGADDE